MPSQFLDSWMVSKAAVSVEEVAIALQEIQSASVAALPATAPPNQDQLSAAVLIEGVEMVEGAIKQPDEETAGIIAEAKVKISAVLSKFARPSKKRVTLEANMAEARGEECAAFAAKPSNAGGGLVDYLRQIEVADEVW